MRIVALSLSALMLAGCGNASGDLVAPTAMPEEAGEIVQELFEICGTAINGDSVIEALPLAGKLRWEADLNLNGVGPIDIMRSTMIQKSDTEYTIQFTEHDHANSKVIQCQLLGGYGDNLLKINPVVFDGLEGFEGRWAAVKPGSVAGHWSQKSGNSILTIFTTVEEGSFSMVSMSKVTFK